MTSTSGGSDPWGWTVDQVVSALCDFPGIWPQISANAFMLDLRAVEIAIRAHAIDGMNLLLWVDREAVRQQLGVNIFGHQGIIMLAIDFLRHKSPRYQAHIRAKAIQQGGLAPVHPGVQADYIDLTRQSSPPPVISAANTQLNHGPNANTRSEVAVEGFRPTAQATSTMLELQNSSQLNNTPITPGIFSQGPMNAATQDAPNVAQNATSTQVLFGAPSGPAIHQVSAQAPPQPNWTTPQPQVGTGAVEARRAFSASHVVGLSTSTPVLSEAEQRQANRQLSSTHPQGSMTFEEPRGPGRGANAIPLGTNRRLRLWEEHVTASAEPLRTTDNGGLAEHVQVPQQTEPSERSPRRKIAVMETLPLGALVPSSPLGNESPPGRHATEPPLAPSPTEAPIRSPVQTEAQKAYRDQFLGDQGMPTDALLDGPVSLGRKLDFTIDHANGVTAEIIVPAQPISPAPGHQRYVCDVFGRGLRFNKPKRVSASGRGLFAVGQSPTRHTSKSISPSKMTLDAAVQDSPSRRTPQGHSPWNTDLIVQSVERVAGRRRSVSAPMAGGLNPSSSPVPEGSLPTIDDDLSIRDAPIRSRPVGEAPSSTPTVVGKDDITDYDHLYHWESKEEEDETLPLFGESGSEAGYDSDTWEDIEKDRITDERRAAREAQKIIPRDRVVAIVKERIDELVQKWREEKLPKLEEQAWYTWRRARKDRRTPLAAYIQYAQDQFDYVNLNRLPRLEEEIAGQIWKKEHLVRHQCIILEANVFEREKQRWTLNLLRNPEEPARPPPREVLPRAPRPARLDIDSDDEDLDSDSDRGGFANPDAFIMDDEEENRFSDYRLYSEALRHSELPFPREGSVQLGEPSPSHVDVEMEDAEASVNPEVAESSDEGPTVRTRSRKRQVPDDFSDGGETRNHTNPPSAFIDLTGFDSEDEIRPDEGDGVVTPPINSPSHDANPFRTAGGASETRSTTPVVNLVSDDMDLDDLPEVASSEANEILLPPYHDVEAVASKSIEFYERLRDRKRLLIKVLHEWPKPMQRMAAYRTLKIKKVDYQHDIFSSLRATKAGENRIRGQDEETSGNIAHLAQLYCMWCESKTSRGGWQGRALDLIIANTTAFDNFYDTMREIVVRYMHLNDFKGTAETGPSKTGRARGTTKRRVVPEDEGARQLRESDHRRVQEMEKRKLLLEGRLEAMGTSVTGDPDRIIVNIGKYENQPAIYLHPRIGHRVKKHQIDGIQFMWGQVVRDDQKPQGCLLAHEMGLGKTMQVIGLLVTIAEAARSVDPEIANQIPAHLKESRTLILCPPGLVDNWWDEVLLWAPSDSLGDVRKIDSRLNLKERLREISSWYHDGGLLIMGYTKFQELVTNRPIGEREARLNEAEHQEVVKHLLKGPHVIVADEAHTLKNPAAQVSQAAARLQSHVRIALTGSPLANDLDEYYRMIDWVAPGYLGSALEFQFKYAEPIQRGGYADSSEQDIRRAKKMLHVLTQEIGPKVSRADISVLKGQLTTKTEFSIVVPLTPLQHRAYRLYVDAVLSRGDKEARGRVLDLVAVLGLLCNHPKSFLDKLQGRELEGKPQAGLIARAKATDGQRKSSTGHAASQADPGSLPDDLEQIAGEASAAELGLSGTLAQQEAALFAQAGVDLESPELSNKALVLQQILTAAEKAGDKTLVFSQRIPTLDYVERLCQRSGRSYQRLDGKTKMSDRQLSAKAFNDSNDAIYLISTRAGGLGLNLPGANRVVLMDHDFNPTWEKQAVGRAYRIGQQKPVFVYRLKAGGTFEENVENKAVFKTQLASRVVDQVNAKRQAVQGAQKYLFYPKEVIQDDLSEFRNKDPLVLDFILARQEIDHSIRKIVLTETFQDDDDFPMTEEELKEANEIARIERLRRTDPEAYRALEVQERQRATQGHTTTVPTSGPGTVRTVQETYIPPPILQPTPPTKETPIPPPILDSSSSSLADTEAALARSFSPGSPSPGGGPLDVAPLTATQLRTVSPPIRSTNPFSPGDRRSVSTSMTPAEARRRALEPILGLGTQVTGSAAESQHSAQSEPQPHGKKLWNAPQWLRQHRDKTSKRDHDAEGQDGQEGTGLDGEQASRRSSKTSTDSESSPRKQSCAQQ
ncbi:MAG: hypothetical protein M1823_005690 [Watsoniomyces obsoletus]|nr:MAG: hypothetical protein M1823_005690 [Watsoniomyces obsoletus]